VDPSASQVRQLAQKVCVPNLEADVWVQVAERPHCLAPRSLKAWLDRWERVHLAEIVYCGTLHYQHHAWDARTNPPDVEAQMRRVWEQLRHANPRTKARLVRPTTSPEVKDCKDLLIVDPGSGDDARKQFSQIYGEAMGLTMAKRITHVSHAAITKVTSPTPSLRHDYELLRQDGSLLKLEAKGSFRRKSRTQALDSIDRKLASAPCRDFRETLAILAYPSDTARRRTCDVEIVDPPGRARALDRAGQARRVLQHYFRFMCAHGARAADVVRNLLEMSDGALTAALDQGVQDLEHHAKAGLNFAGRHRCWVRGDEYWGTSYETAKAWDAPPWVRKGTGYFFWGIPASLVTKLGSWRLLELLVPWPSTGYGISRRGMDYYVCDDGIIGGWADCLSALRGD